MIRIALPVYIMYTSDIGVKQVETAKISCVANGGGFATAMSLGRDRLRV